MTTKTDAGIKKRGALLSVLTLAACCALIACDAGKTAPKTFDHAADKLPFVRPALKAIDVLPDAAQLSDAAKKKLALQRAFFARDFVALDREINEAHQGYVDGRLKRDGNQDLIDNLEATQLAGIDACNDWLAAMPASYAAHWVCGAIWSNGASIARSGEYANKVTPVRFAMMRERLQRSNLLLERALTLSPKPVEALALLGHNHYLASQRTIAEDYLARAEKLMPADVRAHQTRMHYTLPEWGGSAEEVAKLKERAAKMGVDQDDLRDLHDTYIARPHKLSTPGAERVYWEQAIAEKPTFTRLMGLAHYYEHMANWRDAVPAMTRLIEHFPDHAVAYQMRADAHTKIGNIPAALADNRMAAALGNDFSTQNLIQGHIQGNLGLPAKSWVALEQVCRYGAGLGSAAAANCMASMFWEGNQVGPPFHTDIPQAFAWHQVAARGGYYNSQYDLGWLMMTGRAPGVDPEQGKTNGLFWLRRAAEQDHLYARKKLEEGGFPESEPVADGAAGASSSIFQALYWLIQRVL
jgi:tetratricopeptide (TPR) repeat protein